MTLVSDFGSVSRLLADRYAPEAAFSRWYCSDLECDGLPHRGWEWRHCRKNQRPPDSDWFIWLLLSGRGFGKSRCAAEWLVEQAKNQESTEWAVVAPVTSAARKCAEDLNVGIVNIAPEAIEKYNRALGDIYFYNGSVIHLVSADKPDRLRGYNLAGAWCDEMSSWRYPDAWHLGLLPALRDRRVQPRVVITTTPKPVTLLRELVEEDREEGSVIITRGSTFDNAENLAPKFLDEMRARYEGTRRGRQELYGELLTDVEGALVSIDMIDRARLREMPPVHMTRTVIAVDPATTSGEDSDETGIVVVARGVDNRGYVLADLSGKFSPDGWATVVAHAYEEFKADRVVAEKNQGGDMVEQVVRSVHPNIAYKGVHAKVGKKLRAEPIAALYEQGKVSHVGHFAKLEDQWTTWVPDAPSTSQKSPDRVDALVHGMTELGLAGLPGARGIFETEHPPCHICGMPSPKGTVKCPKCGAELIHDDEDNELIEEEPVVLSGEDFNAKVMEVIGELNPQNQWLRRWQ